MSKALIIYHSKTGTTKKFGFAIRDYIQLLDIECKAISIQNFTVADLNEIDFVFVGCWTSGLFFIMQGPEKEWIEFSKKMPELNNRKVALFATYKLLTGSMFSNIKKHLKPQSLHIGLNLKSRNTTLSEENKIKIKQFFIAKI